MTNLLYYLKFCQKLKNNGKSILKKSSLSILKWYTLLSEINVNAYLTRLKVTQDLINTNQKNLKFSSVL